MWGKDRSHNRPIRVVGEVLVWLSYDEAVKIADSPAAQRPGALRRFPDNYRKPPEKNIPSEICHTEFTNTERNVM